MSLMKKEEVLKGKYLKMESDYLAIWKQIKIMREKLAPGLYVQEMIDYNNNNIYVKPSF